MSKQLVVGLMLPILLVGCSCRRETGPPAPSAGVATKWTGPTNTSSGKPAAQPTAHPADDMLPAGLRGVPLSHGPTAYGMPLVIEVPPGPEVPENIRNPTPMPKIANQETAK